MGGMYVVMLTWQRGGEKLYHDTTATHAYIYSTGPTKLLLPTLIARN